MTDQVPDWLRRGRGQAPDVRWSFMTDASLVDLAMARETGEILAADDSGGLSLLDRRGQVIAMSRGFPAIRALAWSDVGDRGVAAIGESRLCCFDRRLEMQWSVNLPAAILSTEIDAHGHYVLVGMDNAENWMFDIHKRRLVQFTTIRPLGFLQFGIHHPQIVGAAQYGLLCCHHWNGEPMWSENLWSNVGDLTVTGDGKRIVLAGFMHGLQMFDAQGETAGSFVLDGTPQYVDSSFDGKRLAVSTLEGHLYWLTPDGAVRWATHLPEEVSRIVCDPLGRGLVLGFSSGRVMKLAWESP